ncbi:MAG: carbohydrate kinase family protein [Pikeienuella sp.]|uniref:carbohydrate kinase family protein n=1 Tax=Pikeienuella sp. TaxID=2831957 RepID=UPI00391D6CA3
MFVICGEALIDVFAAPGGPPFRLEARIGGSPFNVAVGMARLGARAALFTGLAEDMFGRALRAALEAEGVETSLLRAGAGKTTLALAMIGPDGGADYAFYGEDGAEKWIGEGDLPALPPETAGLHFGSYTMVTEPVASAHLDLARREAGRRLISYDPNVRPTVEPDPGRWRAAAAAMAALADLVKLSEEDAAALFPGEGAGDVLDGFLAAGAKLAVMTAGAKGALARGPFGEIKVPSPSVDVVDTIGAGDSFQASLLAEIARRGLGKAGLATLGREAASEMLAFAARAAALTCARKGADPPRRNEL